MLGVNSGMREGRIYFCFCGVLAVVDADALNDRGSFERAEKLLSIWLDSL